MHTSNSASVQLGAVLGTIGGFAAVRQARSGSPYVAQMGSAATAFRHRVGTASLRCIGRKDFYADS
jgi:hypothetical protein